MNKKRAVSLWLLRNACLLRTQSHHPMRERLIHTLADTVKLARLFPYQGTFSVICMHIKKKKKWSINHLILCMRMLPSIHPDTTTTVFITYTCTWTELTWYKKQCIFPTAQQFLQKMELTVSYDSWIQQWPTCTFFRLFLTVYYIFLICCCWDSICLMHPESFPRIFGSGHFEEEGLLQPRPFFH